MSDAAKIARETSLGPFQVAQYLRGGLDGDMIRGIHNLARVHGIATSVAIDRLFSWDPISGYSVRPDVQRRLREGLS